MADNIDKEKQAFMEGQFKNLRLTSIFLFPFVAFIAFRAQDILPFLFGKEAESMVMPFQIIVWTVVFIYYNYIFLRIALFLNKKRIIFLSLTIEALAAVMLNFSLIPAYGLVGVSIATIITGLIMFMFIVFQLTKDGIRIPLYKSYEKPAIATMALAVILHYVDLWAFPLILSVGFVGYSLTLIITMALDK